MQEEGHLGFRASGLRAFCFLSDEYGFEVKDSTPVVLYFKRGDMFVDLTYSPHDPSGNFTIGRISSDGVITGAFSLDHVWYAVCGELTFDYEQFDFMTALGIRRFMESAASLIRQFDELLSDSSRTWSDFQKKADERDAAYSLLMERLHDD